MSVVVAVALTLMRPPSGAPHAGLAADAGALPTAAAPPPAPPAHSPPVTLVVPGHIAPMPVDPVAVGREGALALPASPFRLGWWALGARPGDARGTVLLAAHLDSAEQGAGPFQALHTVPLGADVRLTTADGVRHTYTLVARRTHPKAALPRDLFAADGVPRLALVTCTGAYDPGSRAYADNLVLYGVPARGGQPVEPGAGS
ncbi:class F sortase [Streptomyces sp. SP18CS02]|uniref:class F sortase n=1 Tax=Streptomyces sp. SP18CS02 TaxID=3002531 RepID=UPI002E780186|nr:class F sortase [Streptomyces sp. SP18CS02]MEE1753691.1 class F sortase [Streptomyces sp. SP18CS02]